MTRLRAVSAALMLSAPAALGGCSTYYNVRYDPGPVEVRTPVPESPDAEPARTVVSVVGIRRRDAEAGLPESVEVALRIDAGADAQVTFDPASLVLYGGDMREFPYPIVQPHDVVEIASGGSAVVRAFFPIPEEDVNLESLNVKWRLTVNGKQASGSASFVREPRYYRYPRHYSHHFHLFHSFCY